MRWHECKALIKQDAQRFYAPTVMKCAKYVFTHYSFCITFWFRIGSYLRNKRGLWRLAYNLVYLLYKHNSYKTGIQLPLGTQVGGGLFFAHFSCIVFNVNTVIGSNCTVFQGVTVGGVDGPSRQAPTVGNNVVLSSGCKVLGNIAIGNNVIVGANAVVLKDVPDNAVVAGVPAKILSLNGKKKTDLYKIM